MFLEAQDKELNYFRETSFTYFSEFKPILEEAFNQISSLVDRLSTINLEFSNISFRFHYPSIQHGTLIHGGLKFSISVLPTINTSNELIVIGGDFSNLILQDFNPISDMIGSAAGFIMNQCLLTNIQQKVTPNITTPTILEELTEKLMKNRLIALGAFNSDLIPDIHKLYYQATLIGYPVRIIREEIKTTSVLLKTSPFPNCWLTILIKKGGLSEHSKVKVIDYSKKDINDLTYKDIISKLHKEHRWVEVLSQKMICKHKGC